MGYITFKCLKQKGRDEKREEGLQGLWQLVLVLMENLRSGHDKSYLAHNLKLVLANGLLENSINQIYSFLQPIIFAPHFW